MVKTQLRVFAFQSIALALARYTVEYHLLNHDSALSYVALSACVILLILKGRIVVVVGAMYGVR